MKVQMCYSLFNIILMHAQDFFNYSDIWFGIQFLVDDLLNKVCDLIKEDV